jgi:hypothetical protein
MQHAFASVCVFNVFLLCWLNTGNCCFSRNVVPSTGPSSSSAPRRCQVLGSDCRYNEVRYHRVYYMSSISAGVSLWCMLPCCIALPAASSDWYGHGAHVGLKYRGGTPKGPRSIRLCSKVTEVTYLCTEKFPQARVWFFWRLAFRSVLCQAER